MGSRISKQWRPSSQEGRQLEHGNPQDESPWEIPVDPSLNLYQARSPSEEIKVKYRKRKRRRTSEEPTEREEIDSLMHDILSTPKKKKLKTTSEYIYQNLFKGGKDSDITINALGIAWKLHKLYLCQSHYFEAFFSGRWKDGDKDNITIQIDDTNITQHSLSITLGSFYRDDVTIEPSEVVSVLATASLFQLDGLINQCSVIMEETINMETVVKYYEASDQYGCDKLKRSCIDWLLVNLLIVMPEYPDRLREIPACLMEQLVASPHLFVMQTEFSVYVLLRLWLYLILHPAHQNSSREIVNDSQRYFQSQPLHTPDDSSSSKYFLHTEVARPYLATFKKMRIEHLMGHHLDLEILIADRLIPEEWLNPAFFKRWMSLLRIDSGMDKGPQNLSEETFNKECYRCGRMLALEGQHMWRWTGFNAGLDLIITYVGHRISLQRNTLTDHAALISNHQTRIITYRVTVASLNDQKQKIYEETSGISQISLALGQSVDLLSLDATQVEFPLYLAFSFVVNSPVN